VSSFLLLKTLYKFKLDISWTCRHTDQLIENKFDCVPFDEVLHVHNN